MTVKVKLHLHGPMDHLRIVWQTGEALLDPIPFEEDPDGTRYNVLLAVQEMVTNVLRHAYEGDEESPILVEFTSDDAGVGVEIRDSGPAFNPVHVNVGPPADGSMPEVEGGYGIMITRMVMDDFEYERDHDWNVLRMYKSVAPVSSTAQRN